MGDVEPSLVSFVRLLHPDDQEATFTALAQALEGGDYWVAFRLLTKAGEYRWFRSPAKVLRDEHGEHRRMAGSLQDIDDSKRIQADIRLRQEELGAIAAISPDGFSSLDEDYRLRFSSGRGRASDRPGRLSGYGPDLASRVANADPAQHPSGSAFG